MNLCIRGSGVVFQVRARSLQTTDIQIQTALTDKRSVHLYVNTSVRGALPMQLNKQWLEATLKFKATVCV